MASGDVTRATSLLGELRKIIIRQDELICQKQMDIEDLQRERDELRRQVYDLNSQLASSQAEDRRQSPAADVGVVLVSGKVDNTPSGRATDTKRSESSHSFRGLDVDVKSKVLGDERRASQSLDDVFNNFQASKKPADTARSDEEADDVGDLRCNSDVTTPVVRVGGSLVRRHTVGHKPGDCRVFRGSGRRRRLTQRRVKLPPINRNSMTWEGAYILSPDMEVRIREKILSELSKKYGELDSISRAATIIQTAFRGYKLRKHLRLIKAMPYRQRSQTVTNLLLSVACQHVAPSLLRSSSACSPHGLSASLERGRRARSTTPPRPAPSAVSPIDEAPSQLANGHDEVDSGGKHKVIEIFTVRPAVVVENASGDDTSSREMTPFDNVGLKTDDTTSVSSTYSEFMIESPELSRNSSEMSVDMSDSNLSNARVRRRGGEGRTDKERLWQVGINHFNRKSNKGVLFLVSEQLLDDSPFAVAKFLLTKKGLSKLRIGEYLGDQNDFNVAVLHEVSKLIELKGLSFIAALRKYQSHFILPGEAQKIDRIIETFATSFSLANHGAVSHHKDTIFILAFSTIMLNTDLHNPSVKHRMTKEDFVRNNRGIDNGKNLPKFLLENIYESIKAEPLTAGEDHCSQVERIEKQISGLAIKLASPHRRLVQMNHVSEVPDPYKKQAANSHPRVVYLFNDLLLLVKESQRGPYKYHVKQCVALCGLAVKEFQNINYKFGVTLESTYHGKLLHLSASTSKQREMFIGDLQEVLIEVEDMESERLAEMETLSPSLSRQRPSAMSVPNSEAWKVQGEFKRRNSSVSLSPHLSRRSTYSEAYLDDISLSAASFPGDLCSVVPNTSNRVHRLRRAASPTPSLGSTASSVSTNSGRRGFLGRRKKDKL